MKISDKHLPVKIVATSADGIRIQYLGIPILATQPLRYV